MARNDYGWLWKRVKMMARKIPTMQQMYGTNENHKCKECAYHYAMKRSKTYHKCELWNKFFEGSSSCSDIRVNSMACGKFEAEEEQ